VGGGGAPALAESHADTAPPVAAAPRTPAPAPAAGEEEEDAVAEAPAATAAKDEVFIAWGTGAEDPADADADLALLGLGRSHLTLRPTEPAPTGRLSLLLTSAWLLGMMVAAQTNPGSGRGVQ
jgi:hypothetical protein